MWDIFIKLRPAMNTKHLNTTSKTKVKIEEMLMARPHIEKLSPDKLHFGIHRVQKAEDYYMQNE
jgi:hypothetical protein